MSRMQENQTLKQRAERAEADNARLRVESDMLHYTFHNSEEDWFPMKFTYGMWRRDVCRLMIEKGYWSRGVPEYAQALADTEGGK